MSVLDRWLDRVFNLGPAWRDSTDITTCPDEVEAPATNPNRLAHPRAVSRLGPPVSVLCPPPEPDPTPCSLNLTDPDHPTRCWYCGSTHLGEP